MNIIQMLLDAIAAAGKVVTDKNNWSLQIEDPYSGKAGAPIHVATVDSVTTPDKSTLEIAFTYNKVQYTMRAQPHGDRAQILINGNQDVAASMVVRVDFPIHVDVRPVNLPNYANVVRLDFRFH